MKKFSIKDLKIALIYDRVNTPYGGAEKVLLALHQIFPNAPLYTSVYDPNKAKWAQVFKIIPSFLQKIPFAKNNHRLLVALMPLAFESFNLKDYDIVISITSAEAKGVITNPKQLHICYLLTPTRYLYSHKQEYLNSKKMLNIWPISLLSKKIFNYLKWWDQIAANRPDVIIPISKLVQQRCQNYYHRDTEAVIYPPVKIENILNSQPNLKYYLVVSRLVSYKQIDLAIQACLKLGRNLLIVGDGPEKLKLMKLVDKHKNKLKNQGKYIIFLGHQSKERVAKLYNNCIALLMPGEEDFGITALEANAHGKPVLINMKSGAAQLIENKKHGLHLGKNNVTELTKKMQRLEKIQFDINILRQNAHKYGTSNFMRKFVNQVNQLWQKYNNKL